MEEEWRDVLQLWSFDSYYNKVKLYTFPMGEFRVSNLGRFMRNGQICDARPDAVGTKTFCLHCHRFKLHQIVLQTFCPEGIMDGYTPDHINRCNRGDNSLKNLRWASWETQVANRDNSGKKRFKPVLCDNNGAIYESCAKAEIILDLPRNTVSRVARGGRKEQSGYKFHFVVIDKPIQLSLF